MARAAAAAAAPARQQPARRQPARRAPAKAPAKAPARRVSGRTAPRKAPVRLPLGARLLDTLLNGRAWIGLVGVLLAGIVFFNVDLLRMNREITHMADRAAELKRENTRIRHDVAQLAGSERIQQAAGQLGLVLPAPGEVRYLKSNPVVDAHNASKRIIAPNPSAAPDPIVAAPTTPVTPPATTSATTPPTTTTPPTSATAASPTG